MTPEYIEETMKQIREHYKREGEVLDVYDDMMFQMYLTQTHNNALKVAVEEIEKAVETEDWYSRIDKAIKNIKEKMISPRNPQE
jgi:23S rRNA G2069 N7-methylase RlmK/C1962 C5-methylase RlmI